MDDMETDYPLVVLDTPDRKPTVRQQANARYQGNQSPSVGFSRRISHCSNHIPGCEESNAGSLDTESLFKRAQLARQISSPKESSSSPLQTWRSRRKPESYGVLPLDNANGGGRLCKYGQVADVRSTIPMDVSYPSCCPNGERKVNNDSSVVGCSKPVTEVSQFASSPVSQSKTKAASGSAAIGSRTPGGNYQTEKVNAAAIIEKADNASSARQPKCNGVLLIDVHPRISSRRLVRNGHISPCNPSKGVVPVYGKKETVSGQDGDLGEGTEVELLGVSTSGNVQRNSKPFHLSSAKKNSQQEPLRKGFISASEMVKAPITSKEKNNYVRKTGRNETHLVMPSSQFHIVGSDTEEHARDKRKGKEILDEHSIRNAKSTSSSNRWPANERVNIGETPEEKEKVDGACSGWRSTRAVKRNTSDTKKNKVGYAVDLVDEGPAEEHINLLEGSSEIYSFDASPSIEHLNLSPIQIPSSAASDLVLRNNRDRGPQNLINGKRKTRSGHRHHGESSTSNISESLTFLSSDFPEHPSHSLPSRNNNPNGIGRAPLPIINVDELSSPEPRPSVVENRSHVASNSSVRNSQVDSDEMLARKLQEQLFNESLGFVDNEMDESLARSLQQEEDALRLSFARRSRQSNPRDTSLAQFSRQHTRRRIQNSSGQPSSSRSSSRGTHWRRNLSRHHMDLETRLDYLEAREAVFDNLNRITPSSIDHLQRDFTEDNYEMLLTLDNNIHQQLGATRTQINALPESVIQNKNLEEACIICLETPSVGDTIRHLPCFHKFHKDCIDTWLSTKSSCPICKSGIIT